MNNLPKDVQRKLDKLAALEAGGVDNWEWYDDSLKDWFADNEVDELIEEYIDSLPEAASLGASHEYPAGSECGANYIIDAEENFESILRSFREKVLEIEKNK